MEFSTIAILTSNSLLTCEIENGKLLQVEKFEDNFKNAEICWTNNYSKICCYQVEKLSFLTTTYKQTIDGQWKKVSQ